MNDNYVPTATLRWERRKISVSAQPELIGSQQMVESHEDVLQQLWVSPFEGEDPEWRSIPVEVVDARDE